VEQRLLMALLMAPMTLIALMRLMAVLAQAAAQLTLP
jgi:hypothetical protein